MEDWQEWQIRADQVAAALGEEVDALQQTFFAESSDPTYRAFWPRFRDLKERVRTAPAIKLEAKLDLERRLRDLGSRAYKAQEAAYSGSSERKTELLSAIASLRATAEGEDSPRALRTLRRDLDAVRSGFDTGSPLVPGDRQAVWDAWRDASQFVWQRLTGIWEQNETHLREILGAARSQLEGGNTAAARQGVGRFFEALRSHESRQNTINSLKAEAEAIRRDADQAEERRASERRATQQAQLASPVEGWRSELDRNREAAAKLAEEVAGLEQEYQESGSILDQAMIRGTLVDKRQKLAELERSNRALEQRIEQTEETPLISAG